jgi:hypothetical protein
MRCMACGEEMRLVQVVPDDTMPVPGYEHHTLACPGCHDVERRLVFSRDLEPVPFEPRPLPHAARAARADRSSIEIPPDAVMPSSGVTPPSSWARAVDRLRNQQSSLQARQADAKASATADQMRRDWQEVVHSRRVAQATAAPPASAKPPIGKASDLTRRPDKPASAPVAPADRSRSTQSPSSAMARVIARLRGRDARHHAGGGTADERRRFDQMWESFAPTAQPSAPTLLPQPAAAVRSGSLVPIGQPTGEAWSTVARAMTLLRAAP